jgi:hypothetical protein
MTNLTPTSHSAVTNSNYFWDFLYSCHAHIIIITAGHKPAPANHHLRGKSGFRRPADEEAWLTISYSFSLTSGKKNLSLCLIKHYAMKPYGGLHVQIHIFLTSALVAVVVKFTPRQHYARYPLDRRLGRPQNQSGRHREENILDPTETRTPPP